jgi:hypothetical protein
MRMQKNAIALTMAALCGGVSLAASAETLTIATVNNGDMIRSYTRLYR